MFGLLQKGADEISTLSVFLFLWWRAPINVSIEVQKAARTDLLYHALHGSQMPKVKCNQWARLFHSFPWLRQKQRVNPSLLLTGSLPVIEAECQGEKETPGRGWERIYQRGHSIFRKTLLWNLMCKHWHRVFWWFFIVNAYFTYLHSITAFLTAVMLSKDIHCNITVWSSVLAWRGSERQQVQWKDSGNNAFQGYRDYSFMFSDDMHVHVFIL